MGVQSAPADCRRKRRWRRFGPTVKGTTNAQSAVSEEPDVYVKRVISLGAHCQVAHQIERYYRVPGIGPFEWLVTPYSALLHVLADRAQSLGKAVSMISDGHAGIDANYGVCFHHEFDRDADDRVILYEDSVARCASKMRHKWESMLRAIDEGPLLFVRLGTFVSPPVAVVYREEATAMKQSQLNAIAQHIDALAPGLEFRLLIVNYPELWRDPEPDVASDVRIEVRAFAVEDCERWEGNDAHWDVAFDAYKLVP